MTPELDKIPINVSRRDGGYMSVWTLRKWLDCQEFLVFPDTGRPYVSSKVYERVERMMATSGWAFPFSQIPYNKLMYNLGVMNAYIESERSDEEAMIGVQTHFQNVLDNIKEIEGGKGIISAASVHAEPLASTE